jgi:cell division protein FtsI/penicillin-binding protein 2
MNNSRDWRFSFLGAILTVLPVLIVVQMIRLQIDPYLREFWQNQIEAHTMVVRTLVPPRGEIYDRYGNLLAGNHTVYEVGVDLHQVRNPQTIALVISSVTGRDYNEVYVLASKTPGPTAYYNKLVDHVSQEKVDEIMDLMEGLKEATSGKRDTTLPSLSGLVFRPHMARSYPERELASNLIGFVGQDGRGYYGVEGKYNNLLSGKSRQVLVSLDPYRVTELPDVPPGASLVLTIDRSIQARMEELLDDAIRTHGADSGTIVILDPRSGELLALATTPRIDLNDYRAGLSQYGPGVTFNRGVSHAYEPGSVFKILTVAAGLDSGAIQPNSSYVDTGVFYIGGLSIYNWNYGAWGPQDIRGCLQHSLNVCLTWIASLMGPETFYTYMREFGIGQATGIDLDGEETGRLKIPGDGDWYEADLGTNSFGQGVSTTPLQMAVAASAIPNGGAIMTPHIVRSLVNRGYQYDVEQRTLAVPMKAETARILNNMLAEALETEASSALVNGYRVAGKTGTAEIPTPTGYTSNQTNASFVGWGPVDDPRFLVFVWLEKPSSSIWGSEVAAPVFKQIVENLVVLLNLPPDEIRMQLRGQ